MNRTYLPTRYRNGMPIERKKEDKRREGRKRLSKTQQNKEGKKNTWAKKKKEKKTDRNNIKLNNNSHGYTNRIFPFNNNAEIF